MLVVDPRILALLKPFGLVAADLERPNDPSSYPVLDFLCREVARIVTVVWHDDPDGAFKAVVSLLEELKREHDHVLQALAIAGK